MPDTGLPTASRADPPPAEPTALRSSLRRSSELAVYAWAAPLLAGRRVLDVDVGRGHGAALLLAGGAQAVIGLGPGGPALEALLAEAPAGLSAVPGEPGLLPLDAGSVGAAVWADASADLTAFVPALDELVRVLAPDGRLALGLLAPGRPSAESERPFLDAVGRRFTYVTVADAGSHAGVTVRARASDADGPLALTRLDHPGRPGRIVVLAGHERFDPPADSVVVGDAADLGTFEREVLASREAEIARLQDQVNVLEQLSEERHRALALLEESERQLSGVPDLNETIAALGNEVNVLKGMVGVLEERVERGDRVARDLQTSGSWKLTRPLRTAKDLFR